MSRRHFLVHLLIALTLALLPLSAAAGDPAQSQRQDYRQPATDADLLKFKLTELSKQLDKKHKEGGLRAWKEFALAKIAYEDDVRKRNNGRVRTDLANELTRSAWQLAQYLPNEMDKGAIQRVRDAVSVDSPTPDNLKALGGLERRLASYEKQERRPAGPTTGEMQEMKEYSPLDPTDSRFRLPPSNVFEPVNDLTNMIREIMAFNEGLPTTQEGIADLMRKALERIKAIEDFAEVCRKNPKVPGCESLSTYTAEEKELFWALHLLPNIAESRRVLDEAISLRLSKRDAQGNDAATKEDEAALWDMLSPLYEQFRLMNTTKQIPAEIAK